MAMDLREAYERLGGIHRGAVGARTVRGDRAGLALMTGGGGGVGGIGEGGARVWRGRGGGGGVRGGVGRGGGLRGRRRAGGGCLGLWWVVAVVSLGMVGGEIWARGLRAGSALERELTGLAVELMLPSL